MTGAGRILVVDNHDSFVHTLAGYLGELGADPVVVAADRVGPDAGSAVQNCAGVLISPGPGAPAAALGSHAVLAAAAAIARPVLGVCLGHQIVAEAFGATVASAPELMHGMTSEVRHDHSALYDGVPDPFIATRYHSLAVVDATIPAEIEVTARTTAGTVMGLRHRSLPIVGVQFHPESILTDSGHRLLGNWLAASVGLAGAAERGAALSPLGAP